MWGGADGVRASRVRTWEGAEGNGNAEVRMTGSGETRTGWHIHPAAAHRLLQKLSGGCSAMAMEERSRVGKNHNIILTGREKLSVSGVADVMNFDETEITLQTSQGALHISGSDLHVEKLDLELGEVSVTGLISALDYSEVAPGGSLWSRIFG